MRKLLTLLLLTLSALPLSAQEPDPYAAGLPADVARWIELVMEDSSTVHFDGAARIGADDRISTNVVASRGSLVVAGAVGGHIVVLDGSVSFEPGARVDGDVVVVGGRLYGFEQAAIGGTVTVYDEGFTFEAEPRRWPGREPRLDRTRSELEIAIDNNYNRVDGLPIRIGPELRTPGTNWLRLEAAAILRTERGVFDTRQMGFRALAEHRLPHAGGLRIGASALSVTQPLDTWGLSDSEASLAAALFHDDLRDYYDREGWSGYLRFVPDGLPVDARVAYRSETHGTAVLRDPWTLFNGDHDWRLLPLMGEGRVDLIGGTLRVDTRRGKDFFARGWYFDAGAWRAVDGELTVPAWSLLGGTDPGASDALVFRDAFGFGHIDARRYQPVGPDGILAIRVLAAGSLDRRALPPQYQHALGGPGSLPGYRALGIDCGARTAVVATDEVPRAFPRYGCDRVALAQAEYRGEFDIRFGDDEDKRHMNRWEVDLVPEWVLFFDAGRGWSHADELGAGGVATRTFFDAGAGFLLGDLGVMAAVPLTGPDRSLRFFVRLGPRF